MGTHETHGLGYERVDDDPNVAVLLATMDATARWEATRRLRTWERHQLGLHVGQRLLDVGCGLGDSALALAEDLGDDGEVVGVDASAEMIAVAQKRARTARCQVRFAVGDALALDEPDGYFDVARCERTLQWLTDPQVAVREMARVLRGDGLMSLVDSDWSTFTLDVGDDDVARRVRDAMHTERGRPSNIGGRLPELVRGAGFEVVAETAATQTWTRWHPDESPAPDGCFSMSSLADDLVDTGHLDAVDRERFVATINQAARDDRFSMALTMFAVVARARTAFASGHHTQLRTTASAPSANRPGREPGSPSGGVASPARGQGQVAGLSQLDAIEVVGGRADLVEARDRDLRPLLRQAGLVAVSPTAVRAVDEVRPILDLTRAVVEVDGDARGIVPWGRVGHVPAADERDGGGWSGRGVSGGSAEARDEQGDADDSGGDGSGERAALHRFLPVRLVSAVREGDKRSSHRLRPSPTNDA